MANKMCAIANALPWMVEKWIGQASLRSRTNTRSLAHSFRMMNDGRHALNEITNRPLQNTKRCSGVFACNRHFVVLRALLQNACTHCFCPARIPAHNARRRTDHTAYEWTLLFSMMKKTTRTIITIKNCITCLSCVHFRINFDVNYFSAMFFFFFRLPTSTVRSMSCRCHLKTQIIVIVLRCDLCAREQCATGQMLCWQRLIVFSVTIICR